MTVFASVGRAGRRMKAILASAGVAILLAWQALASFTVIHEAEHDCSGEGCPVCSLIQESIGGFELAGSAFAPEPPAIPSLGVEGFPLPGEGADIPGATLVSLKVRLDE